jgi:hypothetical protein
MQSSSQTIQQNIVALLNELPPDSLPMVEMFIRFMRQQQATINDRPLWRYPTVPIAADSLDNLVGLMPQTEGDALADTEALADEG